MKTFVIAQHHGAFLTLKSMQDCNIDNIVVIIPGSQVQKYNKMYFENVNNPEFLAFQDYDKKVSQFVKENNIDAEVFVYDEFDFRNTATSTLKFIDAYGYNGVVVCILSGSLVIRDYRGDIRHHVMAKEMGACMTRVYQSHNQLSMYQMLGLPQVDKSIDLNFITFDMSKIRPNQLSMNDEQFFNDAIKRKQLVYINREFNGKDDVLIGTAISARQTIAHNLKIQAGYIINLWNKSIKPPGQLISEEIFGYPLDYYSKYARQVGHYLPKSTTNRIISNGEETEKWTQGLYECLDIIDL